jgi:SAM-dependent methyltransferase
MSSLTDPRQIWEQRYYALRQGKSAQFSDRFWLARWQSLLKSGQEQPVLEIGCGSGLDTRYLAAQRGRLFAADYAAEGLRLARQSAPAAQFLQLDLRDGLPFAPASFQVIVASLCLHYFPWQLTQAIVEQLYACLQNEGHLLTRVNSTKDKNYGAVGHPAIEPNYYLVNGEPKRFFDEYALRRLFQKGWRIVFLKELEIQRGRPKIVWEIILQKQAD